MHSPPTTKVVKEKSAIPVSVPQHMKHSSSEEKKPENKAKKQKSDRGKGIRNKQAQREISFVNNCIEFKVHSFYVQKYSCQPQHPKEKREQKKGTNSWGRREK